MPSTDGMLGGSIIGQALGISRLIDGETVFWMLTSGVHPNMRPERIEADRLDRLAEHSGEFLVSIVTEMHRSGPDTRQNRILLKNRLNNADTLLEKAGRKPQQRRNHLQRARDLLDDQEFLSHQLDGLALYVDDAGDLHAYSLNRKPLGITCVSPHFRMRDLVPEVTRIEVLVLGLALDEVHLFVTEGRQIERVESDVPSSIGDVNWFVDREVQLQRHPQRAGQQQGSHGHDPADDSAEELKRFLRAVSDGVTKTAAELDLSEVVVVGDANHVARFRAVTDLDVEQADDGRIPNLSDENLIRDAVAELIEAKRTETEEQARESARAAVRRGDAVTSLDQGLRKSVLGGIETLVFDVDAPPIWGTFDPDHFRITESEAAAPGQDDLIDRLVVHSLATHADVRPVNGRIEDKHFVALPRF